MDHSPVIALLFCGGPPITTLMHYMWGQETALSGRIPIERFYPLGKVCLTVGRRSRALCHALFFTHLFFEGNFDMRNAEAGISPNVSVAHLLLII